MGDRGNIEIRQPDRIDIAGWWTPVRAVLDGVPRGIGDPSNENIVDALIAYRAGDEVPLEMLDLTVTFERNLIAALSA
jgi:hypothetical protein